MSEADEVLFEEGGADYEEVGVELIVRPWMSVRQARAAAKGIAGRDHIDCAEVRGLAEFRDTTIINLAVWGEGTRETLDLNLFARSVVAHFLIEAEGKAWRKRRESDVFELVQAELFWLDEPQFRVSTMLEGMEGLGFTGGVRPKAASAKA